MKNYIKKLQQTIYAIWRKAKQHILLFVGGQLKRKRKQYESDIVGHLGMGTIPMYSENAERSLKRAKEKTMTYIIAGISNKKPFLMTDCVGTQKDGNNNKIFKYRNKLNKLISCDTETYFCLAGADSYGNAVLSFDRECFEKNKSFDFKNEEHITEVLEIFKRVKKHFTNLRFNVDDYARLYFIDKTDIYYYDIEDDGVISILQNVGSDNYYIRPNITMNSPVKLSKEFKDNQELLSFCKSEVLKCANKDYDIDIKDRFSYVIFDEEEVLFDNSVKNNKELVLSLIGGNYNELK